MENVTKFNTTIEKDNTAINSFTTPHKKNASKQLQCPVKDSKIIISPAKINYHRKVSFKGMDFDSFI